MKNFKALTQKMPLRSVPAPPFEILPLAKKLFFLQQTGTDSHPAFKKLRPYLRREENSEMFEVAPNTKFPVLFALSI